MSAAVPAAYAVGVRETELWRRMESALGSAYARVWADTVVMAELGGRTVTQAIADGLDFKLIWRAVWAQLELPASDR